MSQQQKFDSELERQVANRYASEGYTVLAQPTKDALPFDLGNYRPDLLVYKPGGVRYLIEVKSSRSPISVERYRDIAEIVSGQPGWRFLLVLGDEPLPDLAEGTEDRPLTPERIQMRINQAVRLLVHGASEAAFLDFWAVLEALLRNRANEITLPIEQMPTLSLVNHLYSQGELSMQQYDELKALLPVRNSIAHGLEVINVDHYTRRLGELVIELRGSWQPSNT